MSTKLIVTNYKNFKCGVKLNEGELVNIRFQPNEDVQIGDIYKVKIAEILPNDSGAFVTYGKGDQRGFFKQKTAYEIGVRLVGSEMCIRDRFVTISFVDTALLLLKNNSLVF